MTNTRDDPRSTSPENFQKMYDKLPIQSKATIDALINMMTALFTSFAKVQDDKKD